MSRPLRPHPPIDPDDPADSAALENALVSGLTPIEPDPAQRAALRSRLLDRARTSREEASRFVTVRRDDGEWRQLTAGARVKTLSVGTATRSVLLELDAGAVLPMHRHHEEEECVVLRGGAQLGELTVHRGDYHLARAGSRHGRVRSAGGALLYLRGVSLGRPVASARDLITAWLPGKGPAPITVRGGEGPWHDLAPGVQARPLWSDGGESSMLMRLQPGARAPQDPRATREECLMVEGEAFFGDTLLRAGEYQLAPAHAGRREIASDVGALIFVHAALGFGGHSAP